ncbi:hypothetical protein C7271_13685 [filamentous cyanobacterium CCP5]|nr:hypothetical protein C7271_13685 [filamentous cyanobacterium CCP5]
MFSKRPLLIGGLGLSASLWLMDVVHANFFDSSTLLSAIALGSGMWWWQRQRPQAAIELQPPTPVERAAVEQAASGVSALIDQLETEAIGHLSAENRAPWPPRIATHRQRKGDLLAALDRSQLRFGIVGEPGTGKTALLTELQQTESLGVEWQELSFDQDAMDQDGLLLLTAGDLTESVRERLLGYVQSGQAVTLVFNKQDHYLPADRDRIVQQLQRRAVELGSTAVPVEVVAIAAAPNPTRVRRHGSDGQIAESLETTPADLGTLPDQIQRLAAQQTQPLVAATVLRQVESWRKEVQGGLNQLRRDRAMPVVEQLQWAAGASAFAIPVASLDLLAAAAINGQLFMDLGKIYGLRWSADEAKSLAANVAQLTVKLGLVELSTQALAIALKGHLATYAVGGMIQGLSAAYLTRMVGLSLIETLETAALEGKENNLTAGVLGQRLRELLLSKRGLQGLVTAGLERLRPGASVPAT